MSGWMCDRGARLTRPAAGLTDPAPLTQHSSDLEVEHGRRRMARQMQLLEESGVLEREDRPMAAVFVMQCGADGSVAFRCTCVCVGESSMADGWFGEGPSR